MKANIVHSFELSVNKKWIKSIVPLYQIEGELFQCKGIADVGDESCNVYYERMIPQHHSGVAMVTAPYFPTLLEIAPELDFQISILFTESQSETDCVFNGIKYHSTAKDNTVWNPTP